jgi:acetoin utilization protein AcuB
MTWVVVTTGPEATLVEAGLVMIERRIGSLPVVERDRLVGILTEHDLLKALRADTSTDSDAGSDADWPALEAKEGLP